MKNKSRSILISVLSSIFCACIALAFVFGTSGKKTIVHADGENISSTKYMISVDGNYLLLATAFKLSQLDGGAAYAFGYDVSIGGVAQADIYYSSTYYVGITLKSGTGTIDYAPEDIFGEDYSVANGYALIVEELEYTPGTTYAYQVYIEKEGEAKVQGKSYANHLKYMVAFDGNGGSATGAQFVKSGAKASEPAQPVREGYNFIGWKNGEDDYDFDSVVTENLSLTAEWKQRPTLALADAHEYMIDKYNDVAYSVVRNDYAVGELVVKNGETTLTESTDYYYDSENEKLVLKASYLNDAYRFGTTSLSLDLCGTAFTINYENAANRILNGGFDRGTLYGWNSYAIWKNESALKAWTNDRVVNGTYFDDKYSYNRDGAYNLGIYGGSISKDSGQERMGHLRSSNFTLGGSGWVSFKLGGGRRTEFAFVSVRKTSDDTEIARFGNRHFDDKTLVPANNSENGSKKNAEAYLFQYYYDLSDHLGEELYFVISDCSSDNWCVLSADSFYTYYANAPETTSDTLAENILPVIANVATASAEIKCGSFGSGWEDYWTNVSGNYGWSDSKMRSNQNGTGDGGVGVLRSSAFTVSSDNPYLYFKWSGGMSHDKKEFISVKQVGTNIEVLRFVSGDSSETNDEKKQTMNLSALADDGKAYYLEISDNDTGSWGCIFVAAFAFQNSAYSRTSKQVLYSDYHPYLPGMTYVNPY